MNDLEETRAILDAHVRQPGETGAFALSDEYMRAIARIEARFENRTGSDKTWVIRLVDEIMRARQTATRSR